MGMGIMSERLLSVQHPMISGQLEGKEACNSRIWGFTGRCFLIWITFGRIFCRYDHVCKLWDARNHSCTMSVNHGAPIESLAFFPSGDKLIYPPLLAYFWMSHLEAKGRVLVCIEESWFPLLVVLQSLCWSLLEARICAVGIYILAEDYFTSLLLIKRPWPRFLSSKRTLAMGAADLCE